ncbi:tRNA (adenosine(37)-N6)-dimethylallyltransferase MiaA [Hydrogenimonas sp.]
MKTLAILGPTASGKSRLSIDLARRYDCAILSLDSLSVYREIDIASAKPSLEERGEIPHFGIDVIRPDSRFNAGIFIDLYREALRHCRETGRDLIIVGGTGFYLKALMEGMSENPDFSEKSEAIVETIMRDPSRAYDTLRKIDPRYADRIERGDTYRIRKGLLLYHETGIPPTRYFEEHPPVPVARNLRIYEIETEKSTLQRRIEERTAAMFSSGLVDEVATLEKRYGRDPHPMKAIGIAEVLEYFDGKVSFEKMYENIVVHTRQLAKRQKTFNKTQFPPHPKGPLPFLEAEISEFLER